MADAATTFDPFAANGFVPVNDNGQKPGLSPVIDIGGETNIDPAAQPGTAGSGTIASQVGGPPTPNPAPLTVPPGTPIQRITPRTDPVELGLLNDTLDASPGAPAAPSATAPEPTKTTAFDPFAANGFVKSDTTPATVPATSETSTTAPATAPPTDPVVKMLGGPYPPSTSPEFAALPWDQRLKASFVDAFLDPANTRLAAGQSASHGATMGYDEDAVPAVSAAIDSLTKGVPFAPAYDQARQEMKANRIAFEKQNPVTGTALELAGGLASTPVTAPLFGPGASFMGVGRNIIAGAGLGAAAGFGQTEGDTSQRLQGARQGAEMGGVLSAAAPTIGAVGTRLNTALRPNAAIDNLAGGALRDAAGLSPTDAVPTPTPSPLPNMPIGVAGGFNSPGLASTERLLNTTDNTGALVERTAQNQAIQTAATGTVPGLPRLAEPATVSDAATEMTNAMQGAHGVLRDEERRLWTTQPMQTVQPDIPAAVARVQRTIGGLPARFQNAMTRNADVYNALQDFYNLPKNASLHDMNSARSDILAAARGLPASERFARTAATSAGDAILDAIESNPGLRANPQALSDYRRARTYSRRLNDAFEKPQFQAMVNAQPGNRKGLDPAVVGRKAFNLTTASEKTPGGVNHILGMLDDLRRTWGSLATANAGMPLPGLSPAAAFGARAELAQGYRNVIINSMLDAASSTERDLSGKPNIIMNRLSETIDSNRGWIQRSGAMSPAQMDVVDAIRDAAVMAAKREALRGGRGSETFERLIGDRYLDVFLGPVLSRVLPRVGGAIGGAITEHVAPGFGIGALIGIELAGAGHSTTTALQSLYAMPRAALRQRLNEAIRDPAIAADLMRRAGSSVSPQTKQWARSLLAMEPAATAARTLGPTQGATQ